VGQHGVLPAERVTVERAIRTWAIILRSVPRSPELPVSLVRIATRDGVPLDGVFTEPRGRRGTALIWVHGLGSVFSSGQPLTRELSTRLNAAGIAYFKLNTRGHDVVARAGRHLAGAAFERFRHCLVDIRTTVDFVRRRGYRRIILAGHSTGANKALFYAARARDRQVDSIALLGPVSDRAAELKRIGPRELERRIEATEKLAQRDPDALVPREWGFWSAQRYLSLYRAGGDEDVFQYHRPNARWTALRSVRLPLAAILGARDEYLDRPAWDVIDAFRANAVRVDSFMGAVVPRANHGFQGQERALADLLVRWISETRRAPSGRGRAQVRRDRQRARG
jgi:alpha-beta hydrolase superfamily lysophospholipase